MDLVIFSEPEILVVLRALRGIALASGAITQHEVDLIEAVAQLHGQSVDARKLLPIEPAEVATSVTDPHRRKRLVQLATVMALVEGTPGLDSQHAVAELGRALDIDDSALQTLHDLANGSALLARFDMLRRMRGFLMTQSKGLPNLFRTALPSVLGIANEALAAKYHALADCSPGTLGRALHEYYVKNGFHVPGERHGIPEWVVFHDVGHVFAGYSTDPQGEIQQAAFQAGFKRKDGFMFLLFGILQFHVGVRITPIAQAEQGFFDVKRVLAAAARGAACTMDFSDNFDIFAYAHEDLETLRKRWNVAPLVPVAPRAA